MIEKEIKKILRDEFGFVESDYNKTCQTVIEYLSDLIDEKLSDLRTLNDEVYYLKVDKKNLQIMVDELQKEKDELKNKLRK